MTDVIVKVKIPKTVAGITIPYDLIYLVTKEQRELVHKLWQFALVLPFEESFAKVIYSLGPKYVSQYGANRNDSLVRQAAIDQKLRFSHRALYKTKVDAWWADKISELNLTERLVVVPLLWSNREEKLLPRYLGSKGWMHAQLASGPRSRIRNKPKANQTFAAIADVPVEVVAKLKSPLPDLAYLSTPYEAPNDKIRPICSICPRNFQFLQGQCVPGMPVCYKSLDLHSFFKKPDSERLIPAVADVEDSNASV